MSIVDRALGCLDGTQNFKLEGDRDGGGDYVENNPPDTNDCNKVVFDWIIG